MGTKAWASVIVMLVTTATTGVAAPARAAVPGTASCTESGVTWRVDYSIEPTVYGDALRVTGLKRIEGGTETDASTLIWELRYDNVPSAYPPAGTNPPPYQSVRGTLASGLRRPVVLYLSPRLVTPDGACTVYTIPFDGGGAPRVAVLGDELVHQLNDSNYNATAIQGYVEGNLRKLGLRTEVEGHPGARWSDIPDEFRGLLEHDPEGFVVGLGRNDALYIAAGATQAERDARLDEVYSRLAQVAGEMAQRSGCVVAVTAPENDSVSDPDYAAAARKVNDWIRYTAASSATDSWEVADFGAEARTHGSGTASAWFESDNLTLNGAGKLVYTARLAKAAMRCSDSVVFHGKAGTLDDGLHAGKTNLPSGQALVSRAVDNWEFAPGMGPWFSTIAGDGTIFAMNVQTAGNVFVPSGHGMTVTAFNPDHGSFYNIRMKTDRGKEFPTKPDGTPIGVNELDVGTLNGGNAVVFTGSFPYGGQDLETDGLFPVFGVLTKGTDGVWRVAEGPDDNGDGRPDWRNSWSPRELYDATLAADPVNGPAIANSICPVNDNLGTRVECAWASEVTVLPHSNDVVIAHYAPNWLSVLDVTGPDASGRFGVQVKAAYQMPAVDDPSWPDALSYPDPQPEGCPSPPFGQVIPPEAERKIGVAPREVQADPSTRPDEPERFVLGSDASAYRYYTPEGEDPPEGCVRSQTISVPIVEFAYDPSAAPADRIKPASAPVITGELQSAREEFTGLRHQAGGGALHYDRQGNLWMPTGDGWAGLGVKIWAKTAQGRRISRPECFDPAKPLQDYVSEAAGTRATWGKVCRPDYNLLQPKLLGPIFNMDEDRANGNVLITSWPHGITVAVDPDGSGTSMTFKVSNIAGLMVQGVTTQQMQGPCAGDPDERCMGGPKLQGMQGPVDASGRVWVFAMQKVPDELYVNHPEMMQRVVDQWAYSVDIGRLFGREPLRLSARVGVPATVQAELTETVTTVQRPGSVAVTDVESVAAQQSCWPAARTCTDPASGVNGGFALKSGGIVEYRLTVPKAGTYSLTYLAADRLSNGSPARIRLEVNGSTHDTAIGSASLVEVGGPSLTLPAGRHTIRLSTPDNASAGWILDWMLFRRT